MKNVKPCFVTAQVVAFMFGFFVALERPSQAQSSSLLVPQTNTDGAGFPSQAFRPSEQAQIQVGLPKAYPTPMDQLIVQPQIQIASSLEIANPADPNWLASHRPSAELSGEEQSSLSQEILPAPMYSRPEQPSYNRPSVVVEAAPPFFDSMLDSVPTVSRNLRFRSSGGGSLGRERLAFSLFDIDPAQPFNNFRIRTSLANRMRLPDRAEYFWAKAGGSKAPHMVNPSWIIRKQDSEWS